MGLTIQRVALNPPMSPESAFILKELPHVRRIVHDECWLEGERRGEFVALADPVVQQRVADIILSGAGAELRRLHSRVNDLA